MPVQRRKYTFRVRDIPCTFPGCCERFSTVSGLKRHLNHHASASLPRLNQPTLHSQPQTQNYGQDRELLPTEDPVLDESGDVDMADTPDEKTAHQAESQRLQLGPEPMRVLKHPYLDGTPCDADGFDLEEHTPRAAYVPLTDFKPFKDRSEFELADFLFREAQLSGKKVDRLMELLAAYYGEDKPPPFANHQDLQNAIDAIPVGEVPWEVFSISYDGPRPTENIPPWMEEEYTVWYRCPRQLLVNQLGNRSFAGEMDWAPKRIYRRGLKREYKDFMSGDWAWQEADRIAADPATHGAMLCPVILGSDKTTVSVATGQNEYYPAYITNGVVTNAVRRAHRDAVSLFAFLAIPKTDRQYENDPEFRKFRRQLFHTALHHILQPLHKGMTEPEVVKCADDQYRRVIWSLGPYIADYPEQVLLSGIVQGWCPKCTAPSDGLDSDEYPRRSHEHTRALLNAFDPRTLWDEYGVVSDVIPFTVGFPRADIHQLLAPDLLHQVIKGTFKDHLVSWLEEYLVIVHGKAGAAVIMADIDRRIAAVPNFPGLRRFPQGRGFKQWTGDDSKALMKVWLPAISGHVPSRMVRAFSAFLEFCYLVRRDVIDEDVIIEIGNALDRFHKERVIFEEVGVRVSGFSLPRQHSLKHYKNIIRQFGAPNGLCSSITESKHIRAVKQPWRRSNRYKALHQMLVTNSRVDKLAAARVLFDTHGLLDQPVVPIPEHRDSQSAEQPVLTGGDAPEDTGLGAPPERVDEDDADADSDAVEGDVEAEVVLAKTPVRNVPKDLSGLANYLGVSHFPELVRRFIYEQLHPDMDASLVSSEELPHVATKVYLYSSATATYFAPSDGSGVQGMRRERIRSTRSWHGGAARHDCAFLTKDSNVPGFRGLYVVRVHAFLSFKWQSTTYPCALVSWFLPIGDSPCPDTGMWMVRPEYERGTGARVMSVVHIDTMVRGAHLIGIAGNKSIPTHISHENSLDAFKGFYVNKYADHHSHTIAY